MILALAVAFVSVAAFGCTVDGDEEDRADGAEPSSISEAALGVKQKLEYLVQAHPDDEIGGWSFVQRSTTRYPVFILMTQGEETRYCMPGGESANERARGEAAPRGNPYVGRWTSACKDARVGSWHDFLDAMADHDKTLSKPGFKGRFFARGLAGGQTPGRRDENGALVESRSFRVWADDQSARVVFDRGDGDLTPAEVTWAIQSVRSERRALFPRLREDSVVALSYRNTDPRCDVYDHPDHRAVHQAVFGTDQGTPGPQLGRTCIFDPDVARVDHVDEDVWEYAMGVDAPAIDPERHPNARRTGVFQIHYGWLIDAYWPAAGAPGRGLVSRAQPFWSRF